MGNGPTPFCCLERFRILVGFERNHFNPQCIMGKIKAALTFKDGGDSFLSLFCLFIDFLLCYPCVCLEADLTERRLRDGAQTGDQ